MKIHLEYESAEELIDLFDILGISVATNENNDNFVAPEKEKAQKRREYNQRAYQKKLLKKQNSVIEITENNTEITENDKDSVQIQQNSVKSDETALNNNNKSNNNLLNINNNNKENDLNNNTYKDKNTFNEELINAQDSGKLLKKQNSVKKVTEKQKLSPDDDDYWNVFGKKKEYAIAFYREAKIFPEQKEFGRWQKDLDRFLEAGIPVDVMTQAIRQLNSDGMTLKAPGSVFNTARSIMLRPQVVQPQQNKPKYNAFELLAMKMNGIPVPEYDVEVSA